MSAQGELARLSEALRAHLRRREWAGDRRATRPGPVLQPAPRRVEAPAAGPKTAPRPAPAAAPVETLPIAQAADDLATLARAVADCRACGLCETRTQTVFADGSGQARVLFVGEAPGQNEDEQGVPFVGRAGALLTDIITKGMGLARDEVYIANVLKCRPPANRDPSPAEKALCTPFLDRQIELVQPEVLITLGLHASQHVLGSTESMGRLRGRVHTRGSTKVVATYHPAFLLRSPHMKKECWKDIQLAMAELGLQPPG